MPDELPSLEKLQQYFGRFDRTLPEGFRALLNRVPEEDQCSFYLHFFLSAERMAFEKMLLDYCDFWKKKGYLKDA